MGGRGLLLCTKMASSLADWRVEMRFKTFARTCAVVAVLAAIVAAYMPNRGARADKDPVVSESVYAKLQLASVEILVDGRMNGSGCFVDSEGIVLTACHVLSGSKGKLIEVISPTIGRITAKRIATDRGHDLALLSLPSRSGGYPSLEVAKRMPEALSQALLSSSPIWRHGLVLKGSIARDEPSFCWQATLKCYIRCMYIDGASPVGSSGGCWTDLQGRVIGVQSGYLNNTEKAWVGIAFAAPPDAIARLIANRGDRDVATLGAAMEELWTQSTGFIARLPKGVQGLVTPKIHKGGPLDKAGMTRETLIMEIDGEPVAYLDKLLQIVQSKKPGQQVTLKVIEPIGKPPRNIKIRLGKVK
jgi:serine protease Do